MLRKKYVPSSISRLLADSILLAQLIFSIPDPPMVGNGLPIEARILETVFEEELEEEITECFQLDNVYVCAEDDLTQIANEIFFEL